MKKFFWFLLLILCTSITVDSFVVRTQQSSLLMKRHLTKQGGDEFYQQSKMITLIENELRDKVSEQTLSEGLTRKEVQQKLVAHGENVLPAPNRKSLMELWLEQFNDRLVQILLVVAALSASSFLPEVIDSVKYMGRIDFQLLIEPLIIVAILLINAGVGAWQQLAATRELDALSKLQPKVATVLRENEAGQSQWQVNFDASKIVPGDVIRIKVGDVVPADACIISLMSSSVLTLDESSLSGESFPVPKCTILEVLGENVETVDDFDVGCRNGGTIFSGTTVTKGM